jgi:PKD domain-containing protein/K319-like protein
MNTRRHPDRTGTGSWRRCLRPLLGALVLLLLGWRGAAPAGADIKVDGTNSSSTNPYTVSGPSDVIDVFPGGFLNVVSGAQISGIYPVSVGGGTANISGGSLSGSSGGAGVYVASGTVSISGGSLSGPFGVYVAGGTVNISGGSISGTSYDVEVSSATLTIYGCPLQLSGSTLTGTLQDGTAISWKTYGLGPGNLASTCPNIAPSVASPGDQSANEGASAAFSVGSLTDSDGDGPWSVVVDWGDGSPQSSFTASTTGSLGSQAHTYADNGDYTVTVTATDSPQNGANRLSGSGTFTIHVANVPPTPSISGAPASSPEGSAISLTGSATDPSPADTAKGFTYAWAVSKNGSSFASGGNATSFSFTPDDEGTYVVTLTATDKDGGTGSTAVTITGANAPPTIQGAFLAAPGMTSPQLTSLFVGQSFDLDASFTDLGTGDTHTATVNWGDGSTQNVTPSEVPGAGSISVTHTYWVPGVSPTLGTATIKVTVADDDGGSGSTTLTVPVTYSWSGALAPLNGGRVVFKSGSTVTIKFQLTGPSAGITTLIATVTSVQVSKGPVTGTLQPVSTVPPTSGTQFRYDPTSQQYIYNLGTTNLGTGNCVVHFTLGDGIDHTVSFGITK